MRGTNAHCVDEAQVRSSSSSSSKQRATGEWAVNKWNRTVVTLRVLPCSPQWPRPIHWSHKRTVCVRERENEWGGAFFNSNSYCSFFSDTSWAIKPPPLLSPLPSSSSPPADLFMTTRSDQLIIFLPLDLPRMSTVPLFYIKKPMVKCDVRSVYI